jgi:hypothetical protein
VTLLAVAFLGGRGGRRRFAVPQPAVVVLHLSGPKASQAGLAKTVDACCDEWQVPVGQRGDGVANLFGE